MKKLLISALFLFCFYSLPLSAQTYDTIKVDAESINRSRRYIIELFNRTLPDYIGKQITKNNR